MPKMGAILGHRHDISKHLQQRGLGRSRAKGGTVQDFELMTSCCECTYDRGQLGTAQLGTAGCGDDLLQVAFYGGGFLGRHINWWHEHAFCMRLLGPRNLLQCSLPSEHLLGTASEVLQPDDIEAGSAACKGR